jgi:hypothetical protein
MGLGSPWQITNPLESAYPILAPAGRACVFTANTSGLARLVYQIGSRAVTGGSAPTEASIGLLAVVPPGGGSAVLPVLSGDLRWRMYAGTDVNYHWRVDFITDTAYFRVNVGQLSAGEVRTMFATWRSGSLPDAISGIYPNGPLTTPTYFDRGSASGGTFGSNGTCTPFNQDFTASAWAAFTIWWMGLWARKLRIEEMEELHRHPWCLIQDYNLQSTRQVTAAGAWSSRVRHDGQPGARVIS